MSFLDKNRLFESVRMLVSNTIPKLNTGQQLTIRFFDDSSLEDDQAHYVYFFRRPDESYTVSFGPHIKRLAEIDTSVTYVLRKSGWSEPSVRKLRASFTKPGLRTRLEVEQAFEEAIDGLLCSTVLGTPIAIAIREIELVREDLSRYQLLLEDPKRNLLISQEEHDDSRAAKRIRSGMRHSRNLKKSKRLSERRIRSAARIGNIQTAPFYSGMVVLKDHQEMPVCLMSIDPELKEVRWFDDQQWRTVSMESFNLDSHAKSALEPIESSLAARIYPEAFRPTPDSGEQE